MVECQPPESTLDKLRSQNNLARVVTCSARHSSAEITALAGESAALLVARLTNNRKVVGSMPANVVCITVDR